MLYFFNSYIDLNVSLRSLDFTIINVTASILFKHKGAEIKNNCLVKASRY